MAQTLAEWAILIKTLGLEETYAQVKKAEDALKKAEEQTEKLQARSKKAGQTINVAFAMASGTVLGFVRAGMQGTSAGEALSLRMTQLSREIANLFLPAIQKVIDTISRVVAWFKNLSGEQQNAIGKWVMLGVGALGVAAILPKVIGGLKGVWAVLGVINAHPIIAIVAAIGALLVSSEAGRGALGSLFAAMAPGLEAVVGLVRQVGELLAPVFAFLGQIVVTVAQEMRPAFEIVGKVIQKIVEWLRAMVNAVIWTVNQLRRLTGGEQIAYLEEPTAREREAGRGPGQNRNELQAASKGFEDVGAAFKRFQMAALKDPGQATRERQLGVLEQIRDLLSGRAAARSVQEVIASVTPAPAAVGT